MMEKLKDYRAPGPKESLVCICGLALWLAVTILCIGFRPEHLVMALIICICFFVSSSSRRLVVALLPFIIFGISYDWMNLLPNYEVNPIDVRGIYEAEKSLFGISSGTELLTPNEYFAQHTSSFMDFMSGIFYLCWVPLPVLYGIWLFWRGNRKGYLHFSLVFLLVNFIGFALYYVHPAAPPWYPAIYGFEPDISIGGNVAGLGAFDNITGLGIFHALYERNANVFAAFPSLHSAYTFVAFIYAVRLRSGYLWCVILGLVTLGIWFTAVYTSHHYIIDVAGGIGCSLIGYLIFEYGLMKWPSFGRFMNRYTKYISPDYV